MNKEKAKAIIKKYESQDKHSIGLKAKYVKAKAFLRNQTLKETLKIN
jgi:hypothetical protein